MGHTVLADLFPLADFGYLHEGMACRTTDPRAATPGLASFVFRGRTTVSLARDSLAP